MKQILTAIILMISLTVFSQEKTVTGVVLDDTGIPLIGASLIIEGTKKGTVTDFDGLYSIKSNVGDVLIFSYVGMKTKKVTVGQSNTMNITMETDAASLDEVVVIGYGTVRKKDLAGAVASVDVEDAFDTPTARVDNALQGRASGVKVTQSSGAPGSNPVVVIRGGNSITGGNSPLYVVDGFVGADNISNLNPNDIATMDILKDASSTAIYGARGTNGVIIITTKKGKSGKPVVNFKTSAGFQSLPNQLDVQTPTELVDWLNLINPAGDVQLPDTTTNWQDAMINDALMADYQLSVSGGNDAVKYFVSGGYMTQDGIVKGSGFDRYSLRTNLDFTLSKTFKAGVNIALSRTESENNTISFTTLLRADPTKPIYNEDGSYYNGLDPIFGTQSNNLMADAMLDDDNTMLDKIFINSYIQGGFFEDKLIWKSTFGGDFIYNTRHRFTPSTNPSKINNGNALASAIINRSNNQELLNENTLNYTDTFGDSHINVLAGASFQKQHSESEQISAGQIPSDGVNVYAVNLAPAENVGVTSGYSERSYIGFFGRVSYIYKDKYIFNASLRRDGASTLGINERYENFPGVSLAWKIKEESFMKNVNFVNDLKLRVNYGKTGNAGVSPFATIANYGIVNNTILVDGVVVPGVTQGNLAKPNLGWEITNQYDAGLVFSLFKSRLTAEVDVYYKKTEDLLLNENTLDFTGFTTVLTNVGSVENRGIDINLSGVIMDKEDFKWTAAFNISTVKNEVLNLGQSDYIDGKNLPAPAADTASRLIVGQPVGIFWGAKFLGVDPDTGASIFEDISGPDGVPDGEYTPAYDDQVIGNANPDWYGGFQTNMTYKNFDLSAFFTYSIGNENYSEEFFRINETTVNSFAYERDNMWSANNMENALYPAFGSANYDLSSSLYLMDASYLRLTTLQLGYTVPTEQINGINKLRVYFTGNNLFLVKNKDYVGFDPDVSTGNSGQLQRGFDAIAYPQSRSLLIGLDISL